MQNKVVHNVLQQYARSGLIDSLYLFGNEAIQDFAGEATVSSLYDNINNIVSNFIITLNWMENTEPVVGGVFEPKDISRICTVSVGQIMSDKEDFFFPLQNITEATYYYSVSEEDKQNEKNLLTNIRKRVTLNIEEGIECSFGLWENQSDVSFFYSIKYTHFIQQQEV